MKISAKMKGADEFVRKLQRLDDGLKNRKPMYQSLAIEGHKWILENYRKSGALLKGPKWKRLKQSTIVNRRRRSRRPLLDTGQLLMRGWNWKATHTRAIIGHPSEIAVYHEEGGKRWYEIKPKKAKALHFKMPGAYKRRTLKTGGRGRAVDVFAQRVFHPPLSQRRQLPTEGEALPRLVKAADFWLDKLVDKERL